MKTSSFFRIFRSAALVLGFVFGLFFAGQARANYIDGANLYGGYFAEKVGMDWSGKMTQGDCEASCPSIIIGWNPAGSGYMGTNPTPILGKDPACVARCRDLVNGLKCPITTPCHDPSGVTVTFKLDIYNPGDGMAITYNVVGLKPACCSKVSILQYMYRMANNPFNSSFGWTIDTGMSGGSTPSPSPPYYGMPSSFDPKTGGITPPSGQHKPQFDDAPSVPFGSTDYFVDKVVCSEGPALGTVYGQTAWTAESNLLGTSTITPGVGPSAYPLP